MKKLSSKSAFTLIELLVIIAILAILSLMIFPAITDHSPKRPRIVVCMSNQKQTTLALFRFSGDHGNQFPWQVAATNGGAMESIADGHPSSQFRPVLHLIRDLHIFVCPTDTNKPVAESPAGFNDANTSYFLNLDSSNSTNHASDTILSGDRNLRADGKPVKPGLFTLTTNLGMDWTRDLHLRGGVMAFADGHVEFLKTNALNSYIHKQPLTTSRLCIP